MSFTPALVLTIGEKIPPEIFAPIQDHLHEIEQLEQGFSSKLVHFLVASSTQSNADSEANLGQKTSR